jgi:hypothetical protein
MKQEHTEMQESINSNSMQTDYFWRTDRWPAKQKSRLLFTQVSTNIKFGLLKGRKQVDSDRDVAANGSMDPSTQ